MQLLYVVEANVAASIIAANDEKQQLTLYFYSNSRCTPKLLSYFLHKELWLKFIQ